MSSLKILKNEIRQNLDICWHCLFWFDLPIRKEEGKFKQGKILSTKVCQRFLYSLPMYSNNILAPDVFPSCVEKSLLTVLRWFCRATHKVVYWVPWAPLQGAYLRRHTDMRGSVSSVTRTTVIISLWKLSKNFPIVLSLQFSLLVLICQLFKQCNS